MPNLLDRIKPEDRAKIQEAYERRMARRLDAQDNKVSNELYLVAEFGYYFGWEAIMAVRNDQIGLKEMFALVEAARKVWYTKLCEQARATQAATGSIMAKNPAKAFKDGMQPFLERSINKNE